MEVAFAIGYAVLAGATLVIGIAMYSNALPSAGRNRDTRTLAESRESLLAILSPVPGRARIGAYELSAFSRVSGPPFDETNAGLRFELDGLCPSVTFGRPGFSRAHAEDVRPIGDPEFDASLSVGGARADALALLSSLTRTAIRDVLVGNIRIGQLTLDRGTLTVDVPTTGFSGVHPGLRQVAATMAYLGSLLATPQDVLGRLAENLAQDPLPGVRLANLHALVSDYRTEPRTRAALTNALRDADPHVRLEAALAAGAQGRETLIALAIDTEAAPPFPTRALQALGQDLPLNRVGPLVREAERSPAHEGPRAAHIHAFIAAVGQNPSPDATKLLERLAVHADDDYGPHVVEAIVIGRRPGAEAALIRALVGYDEVRGPVTLIATRPATQDAAARHLGAIGTGEAVLPLKQIAQRHGGAIAAMARRSIAQIKERHAGSRGQLALTDDEAGRLSEATDPSGRVTLKDED